ncbi:hypothetical protein [Lactiplantibacillus daowaiensis]|uniref:Bacteriocin immunity protein n=1 Tax=Lactiplantibacillus daowaiensis TaxID=2559918 RepID=A0ABW1S2I6_9LACO
MTGQRQKLLTLIDQAYNEVQLPKFNAVNAQLLQAFKALSDGEDDVKVMLSLRQTLLQADLALKLKNRITGLPTAYGALYAFIAPQLKQVDAKVLDEHLRYGFVPMKFGSTVKYP